MSTSASPLVVWRRGDEFMLGGIPSSFRARAAATGGVLTIMEQTIAPRLLVSPHVHANEDQLVYVVSGTLGIRAGADEATLGAGMSAWRPRGIPHTFWNPTDEPATILEQTTPAHVEGYFLEMAARSRGGAVDPEEVQALAASYGITFVHPEWVEELGARYGVSTSGGFWQDP